MTDLSSSAVTYYVIKVTADGVPVAVDDDAYATELEATAALNEVLNRMLVSGMQMKSLNLLAEGGWIGRFQHYGGSETSLWQATYTELSTTDD